MAKGYSYKDAMEAALEAGMMGMGGGAGGALQRGAAGLSRDRFPEQMEEVQPPRMMDRMMDMEAMKAARDAAKSYGRAYKEGLGMKKGGKVSSASARADGCAIRGKTKGRMV